MVFYKQLLTFTIFFIFLGCGTSSHKDISTKTKELTVELETKKNGIELLSIKDKTLELLDKPSSLFDIKLRDTKSLKEKVLSSSNGWEKVSITHDDNNRTLTFLKPTDTTLPPSLKVIITLEVNDGSSSWDISVSGLDKQTSLIETTFPKLQLKAMKNDTFFIPFNLGKLIKNPSLGINFDGLYPRGFGATMQYMAYYHDNQGLYLGVHDPKATVKHLHAQDSNGSILVSVTIPTPDATLAQNNWNMSGKFVLDLYAGDWYEAALLYKRWVYDKAEYKPVNSLEKQIRQQHLGSIGLWGTENLFGSKATVEKEEEYIKTFQSYMDIPLAVHWNEWYDKKQDIDFPELFPQTKGLEQSIENLHNQLGDNILLSAYMNGRLYDVNLDSYLQKGLPNAIKQEDGSLVNYNQKLVIMCPAAKPWQSTVSNLAINMAEKLKLDSIYIDQVTAAAAIACYDKTHNHSLGGGSYWRDGYKKIFHDIHKSIATNISITSEGACDFLADEVDGFLIQEFVTNNQVPAMSIIYGKDVQFMATRTGTSDYTANDKPDSQRFYGTLAQGFVMGSQTGRIYMSIVRNLNDRKQRAANYAKHLAFFHVKLKNFIAFGQMHKPLTTHGDIPTIEFPATNIGGGGKVKTSAIQTGIWSDGKSIAIVFINAKVPEVEDESITFSFDFDSNLYPLVGDISIKEIESNFEGNYMDISRIFTKEINLHSYEIKAFVITPTALVEQ